MVIDNCDRVKEVASRYGLDEVEAYYLLDSMIHLGYDIMGMGLGGVLGIGIKVGFSLIDFISYVDSGLISVRKHSRMLRYRYGIVRVKVGSGIGIRYRVISRRGSSFLRVYRHIKRYGANGYRVMGNYYYSSTDASRSYVRSYLLGLRRGHDSRGGVYGSVVYCKGKK